MNAQITPAPAPRRSRCILDAVHRPIASSKPIRRLLARAQGMYYWTSDGREILDAVAGLWCVNAGHGRREITEAVAKQLGTMEYAPAFQMGHPIAFELANRAGPDRTAPAWIAFSSPIQARSRWIRR